MASFFGELWESIFTPGTTPTLVKATHYSFAALIVTLVVLCAVTFNKHFFFLTIIALCLWGAITWFIGELEAMKAEMAKQNKPVVEDVTEGEELLDDKTADEKKED
ncbi:ER protein Pkr1-domain-containing protein [Lipomyces arxii]|uniref:ER protein Pkr1-domain-containing protein n=1 Tax=Lipomyces arxii TaxID=56418 RepID=UPI0034CD5E84